MALTISPLYCRCQRNTASGYALRLGWNVFRNLKMQKNAAFRYTAFCITLQDWTGLVIELTPRSVQVSLVNRPSPITLLTT
ncbi:hypothetical protein SAMN04489725_103182 [Alicyclobacillus hesperidum]|uniref:Uncharacterized protein n=1 Tax=Alicyclobacillus hesperidum TaxID=89784 RepID=A0A1H2RXB1_9BACL|nr:hypothetical protein SAMN04489725_103182 [Alicyclobacillus hesperidum]